MCPSFITLIKYFSLGLILISTACTSKQPEKTITENSQYGILVLGIAQDAGIPQSNCNKDCCANYFKNEITAERVTSLAVIDKIQKKYWLLEATPDIKFQIAHVNRFLGNERQILPEGIFLSHAHIGHYTGLMELGREAIGANSVQVYAMPRMKNFLENNGPWSQLVALNNINIKSLQDSIPVSLSEEISIFPFQVPHRDEFSETVGFNITGPERSIIFIPDIDKWNKWDVSIKDVIPTIDVAFVDGTFFDADELPGRNMNEIPHPFITESIKLFKSLNNQEKGKVNFIHFNHTNQVHVKGSDAYNLVISDGFKVSYAGQYESL